MDRNEILSRIASHLNVAVDEREVRALAAELWQTDGCPSGNDEFYWLAAESHLQAGERQKVAARILQALRTPLQESSATIQEEAQRYSQSAVKVLQEEMLKQHQFVLPEGTRFHRRIGSVDYLVVEQQPMLRTILVDNQYHKPKMGSDRYGRGPGDPKQFHIALPYVVYFVALNNLQISKYMMAFRTEPLKSLKDKLYLNVLPNSHEGGTVCCSMGGHSYNNIVDAVNHYIGVYWQAQYRYCLHHHFPDHPAFKSFEAWEKESEANPLFVLHLNWRALPHTLADWLGATVTEQLPSPPAKMQELSSKFVRRASEILTLQSQSPQELTPEEVQQIVKHDLDVCLEKLKKGEYPPT